MSSRGRPAFAAFAAAVFAVALLLVAAPACAQDIALAGRMGDKALLLVQGAADKVISDMVEKEGFDLLAMGAFSHSRLRTLFIGSTTTEMIRSCKVPVVIFR